MSKLHKVTCEQLASEDFEIKIRPLKIASWDIETAANQGDFWRDPWNTSIIDTTADTHMISWSVKVLGGRQITKCLADYEGYEPGTRDDKTLVTELWELLDTFDILVAHHGDVFDLPYTKGRAAINGLAPCKKFKTVDTKKVAKRNFGFTSNKLNDIARLLGLGTKIPIHYEVWKQCRNGDPKAWALMKKYNAHDVRLLEQVYLKFRSWDDRHPNVNVISGQQLLACTVCGSSNCAPRGKDYYTNTGRRQMYECLDCHKRFAGKHEVVTEYR